MHVLELDSALKCLQVWMSVLRDKYYVFAHEKRYHRKATSPGKAKFYTAVCCEARLLPVVTW